MGFDLTGQILIIFSAFVRYCVKEWEYSETVYQFQESLRFSEEGSTVQYSH
jgi:hypothetical protein